MTTITTRQDKVQATIAKQEARLEKLIAKKDEPISDKEIAKYIKQFNDHNSHNIEMGFCDKCTNEVAIKNLKWLRKISVEQLQEQIANNYRKLNEAKRLDKREEERNVVKAQKEKKEHFITENIPQILVDFAKKLEDRTVALHELNYEKYSKMPWPKFNDRSEEAMLIRFYQSTTLETLKENAKSDANNLVRNLFYRVYEKVGDIDDLKLHLEDGNWKEGAVLAGTVHGNKGYARIETIYAGGYNIQCEHIRCLVK